MVTRQLALVVLFTISFQSSHPQRAYDTGEWIPLISSCPTCTSENAQTINNNYEKKASGRVLNIGQKDHPNNFVNNEKQRYRPRENVNLFNDFGNYYSNLNKANTNYRLQQILPNFDSYVEESNKHQHLLAQKALNPLFLNQELQPPKAVSIKSAEQQNSVEHADSKEKRYQNPERSYLYESNSPPRAVNGADGNNPVRFSLLGSTSQPIQHDVETAKLIDLSRNNGNPSNLSQQSFGNQNNTSLQQQPNPPHILPNRKEHVSSETLIPAAQGPVHQNVELTTVANALPLIANQPENQYLGSAFQAPSQNRFTDVSNSENFSSNPPTNNAFLQSPERNVVNNFNPGLQYEVLQDNNRGFPQFNAPPPSIVPYENKNSVNSDVYNGQSIKEGAELLYVPTHHLNKQQQQTKVSSIADDVNNSPPAQNYQAQTFNDVANNERYLTQPDNNNNERYPEQHFREPFRQNQQIEGIQNDYAKQALEAFKLQQQLHSGELPITSHSNSNFLPSAHEKPPKKKSHQPPLAVYMESNGNVKVEDVLNLLKASGAITVQDSVGPDTPSVFVGPYDLESPDGYVKFELPYLSSLDAKEIEVRAEKFPFFVAPINYKAPDGYSKIPLPSPHVGTIVVSEKNNNGRAKNPNLPQSAIEDALDRDILEHKQHYRDTLDQPNYQGKVLPSNVKSQLPIRQTSDQYDFTQANNRFLSQNPRLPTNENVRIPSPQSKFEEEYNRINNIYQTTPRPEISKFVITTSTLPPLIEQQQFFFNPETGLIERLTQSPQVVSQQRPLQNNEAFSDTALNPLRKEPSGQNQIEQQETNKYRNHFTEGGGLNEEVTQATTKPTRGRSRGSSEQTTNKVTRGRGSSHFTSSSRERGDKSDIEETRPKHRGRGDGQTRERLTPAKTVDEHPLRSSPKYSEGANPLSPPVVLGSLPTAPNAALYDNNERQVINSNLETSPDKKQHNTGRLANVPRVPYYEEIGDIRPYNQGSGALQLQNRDEAKKQRAQTVSSLEQNLGIPITSNGATGILSQNNGDDTYNEALLKSTEEPVFEFTTRSEPSKSRTPGFESYEIDGTNSDESREFEDFFLSTEQEEEPKPLKVPARPPPTSNTPQSLNPALPGLINNLQDQSIRSILNPALIAPTTQQSIDEIIPPKRTKSQHLENIRDSLANVQQNYQTLPAIANHYEREPQQQVPISPQQVSVSPQQVSVSPQHVSSPAADNRRIPSTYTTKSPDSFHTDVPTKLNINEQQTQRKALPSGSFSLSQQRLSLPSQQTKQNIDSSTHLPTVETTPTTKRGRGRYRTRESTTTSTTTTPPRRHPQRTRKPLKVESRSESLDHHQVASSTYSPVKAADPQYINVRNQNINDLTGTGQVRKQVSQDKISYPQPIMQVNPDYDQKDSEGILIQREPPNVYYNQQGLGQYMPEPTGPSGNYFPQTTRTANQLPIYQPENLNSDLLVNQPNVFPEGGIPMQTIPYITGPSANAAEQTQSHSSNVQFVHPDQNLNNSNVKFETVDNSRLQNTNYNVKTVTNRERTRGNSQHVNINTAPSANANAAENYEISTRRHPDRTRSRGRTNVAHRTTTVAATEEPKPSALGKTTGEGEEFFGFFRPPNFNTVAPPLTTPASNHANVNNFAMTSSDYLDVPQTSLGTSAQHNLDNTRNKYSSIIRHNTQHQGNRESDTTTTTKEPESTQRSRTRGRTRKPYGNSASRTRTTEPTDVTTRRRFSTTERPSARTSQSTQRLRTRGRTQFQVPASLKEKREDDLETANYPASFLASQGIAARQPTTRSLSQTESPKFQITVDAGFDNNDGLSEYDQLTNPSYVNTRIVMPDGSAPPASKNHLENDSIKKDKEDEQSEMEPLTHSYIDTTTAGSEVRNTNNNGDQIRKKKRGYWKLVKKPLTDPLEASESQNVETFSINYIKPVENKENRHKEKNNSEIESTTTEIEAVTQPSVTIPVDDVQETNSETLTEVSEDTTEPSQESIIESVYEMFGLSHDQEPEAEKVSTNDSFPEKITTPEYSSTIPDNFEEAVAETTTIAVLDDDKSNIEDQKYSNKNLEDIYKEVPRRIFSTETPPKTTNSFEKSMRTLQSTEISHETEICYRGKCVRTPNKSL